jgi:RHS repeat-associated protein
VKRLLALLLLLMPAPVLAQAPAETVEYYGHDAIGSIRVVWDANGNVLARQDYGPFGRQLFPVPAMPKEGFGGQEKDSETDQSYLQARMFQARTGRFTRVDTATPTLLNPQAWNRYVYALNNGVTYSDPSGLCAMSRGDDGVWVQIGCSPFQSGATAGGGSSGAVGGGPGVGAAGGGGGGADRPGRGERGDRDSRDRPGRPQPTTRTGPPTDDACSVPQAPPEASVKQNVQTAQNSRWMILAAPRTVWFYNQVRNGGPWDYKQTREPMSPLPDTSEGSLSTPFERFGNFNYGATGAAAGFTLSTLQRAAGFAQWVAGTSAPSFGSPFGPAPYGDDPSLDSVEIAAGYAYYQQGCAAK